MDVQELTKQIKQQRELVDVLRKYWASLLPDFEVPSDSQFALWLRLHNNDLTTVRHGIDAAGKKHLRTGLENTDHAVRYCSSVMNSYRRSGGQVGVRPRLPEHLYNAKVTPCLPTLGADA